MEVGWVVRLYIRTFLLLLSAELCSAAAAGTSSNSGVRERAHNVDISLYS